MVLGLFQQALKNNGIQEVQTDIFDPNLHEATASIPSDQPEGKILECELKGYSLYGRLLRPARVVVSSGKGKKVAPAG